MHSLSKTSLLPSQCITSPHTLILPFLPPLHNRHPHPNPTLRLTRHTSLHLNHLPRTLKLKVKPPHDRRQHASKLSPAERLPDAAPRPVEKGQKGIIGRGAAGVGFTGAHPALGLELKRVVTPHLLAHVDGRGTDDDVGALGDELPNDRGVVGGDAACHHEWGVYAQDLLAEGVHEGQVLEHVGVDRREVLAVLDRR